MSDSYQIGRRIKQRREALGMTQEELGAALHLNKSSIQRYESGQIKTIKLPIVYAIAEKLDVDPLWLAGKTDITEQSKAPFETIGARIRSRREYLGMTQDELAQRLGYKSRSSVNKIELDSRNLTQKHIKTIADALETTPSFIMGWDGKSEKPSAECEGLNDNIVVLRRRGGGVTTKKLTDGQIDALQAVIDQFSEC